MADRAGARIEIGDDSRLNGVCIHAFKSVVIGRQCLIAANCQIFDGNGHDLAFPNVEIRGMTSGAAEPIIIEDSVWIGANSIILPGTRIGRGSIVAANSVVRGTIPSMVVWGGNPAVLLKDFSIAA